MGIPGASRPVVALGTARRVVDKHEWRSAPSRAGFRADPGPLQVTSDDLDQIEPRGSGFYLLSVEGVRWTQQRLRVDPFVIEMDRDDEPALMFTGRSLRGRPVRAPRPLGTIIPGSYVEVAVNLRWQSERSQTKYIDHVWRFQRPTSLSAGELRWSTPDRVIDMRAVLH